MTDGFVHCSNEDCRARLISIAYLAPIEDYSRVHQLLGIDICQGWQVQDIFDFDNVAISKAQTKETAIPVPSTPAIAPPVTTIPASTPTTKTPASSTPSLRYLCCGECDCGPIGYAIVDGPALDRIIIIDQNKVA